MTTEADKIDEACRWLLEARARTLATFRNLREIQPGFPPNTPGNGEPGGGSSGHGASIVERHLDDNGTIRADDAMADLGHARDLVRLIVHYVRDYHDLTDRWGYATAGEYQPGERRQPGRPTEGDANRERWCSNHEKFGIAEPLGSKGRNGLCGWCYTFQATEGELPSGTLIEHRERGGTVTTAMVDAWRRTHRTSKLRKKRGR